MQLLTRDKFRKVRLVAAAYVAAALTLTLALPAQGAITSPSARVYRPGLVPSTSIVTNPMRGHYRWMNYDSQTTALPATDTYLRDQVYWGRLEPRDNEFNFSYLDAGIEQARATNSKFGFRVMAYCPGCWMTYRDDKATWPDLAPTFIPLQASGAPDWNSEEFLSQWEELMAALGERYGSDPALGYVDVGGYGRYGEWWVSNGEDGESGSTDSMRRIVMAVNNAFPSKHLLINTMTPVDFTLWALESNPLMGLRTDSLGAPNMHSMVTVDARLQGVWRTRPFFSEWATTGDPVVGSAQVSQWHISTTSSRSMRLQYADMSSAQQAAYVAAGRNAGYRYQLKSVSLPYSIRQGVTYTPAMTWAQSGSAPTYDPWRVRLVLRNGLGTQVWTGESALDLRGLAVGTKTDRPQMRVSGLTPGRYQLLVEVLDPSGYSAPMHLANTGRTSSGAYPVGWLRVRQ